MRTLKQIKQQDGVNSLKAIHIQAEEAKSELAAPHGSAPDGKPRYRADFLWPHDGGSVEEAGYEFANGKTPEYQQFWWDILLKRAKTQNTD